MIGLYSNLSEEQKAKRREQVRASLKKRREAQRARGLCVDCGAYRGFDAPGILCEDCKGDRRCREVNRRAERNNR